MDEKEIHRDMPYKGGTAVARELNDSRVILRRYLDGAFRLHEVLDALRHLEYVCGQPVKRATTEFRRCLRWEDEGTRNDMARLSLVEIGSWINRNEGHSGT